MTGLTRWDPLKEMEELQNRLSGLFGRAQARRGNGEQESYGVYRESDGVSERALFVIDPEGLIHWSYVSPIGVNPGAAGILSALEELRSKNEVK